MAWIKKKKIWINHFEGIIAHTETILFLTKQKFKGKLGKKDFVYLQRPCVPKKEQNGQILPWYHILFNVRKRNMPNYVEKVLELVQSNRSVLNNWEKTFFPVVWKIVNDDASFESKKRLY